MKKQNFIKLGLLALFLQSCDCVTEINGFTIDPDTREPIENVSVSLVTDNFTKDDFGIITDSLSVTERKEIISKIGNNEGWEETGGPNMIRYIPLKTDSAGFFNVFWFTGFCPKYKLQLIKAGYQTKIVDKKDISMDTLIFEMKKLNPTKAKAH